jgi:MoaA/NifB/PqqE/SkfB family radical SAM enzyme
MKLNTIIDLSVRNIKQAYFAVTGQTHRIVPYKVVVELTNQCNSRCVTCDIWKVKKEDVVKIDLEKFEFFLQQMGDHLLWLALTGGEITSFNQFPQVVNAIKKHSRKLRILTFTTNGLLPQRILEYALIMKHAVDCDIFVTISLDGDEATHDRLRGVKGNYARCMETYDLLRAHGIDCHFGITVSEGNADFIQKAYAVYSNKIKAVTLFHAGGIFLNEQEQPTAQADEKIIAALKEIYRHYKIKALGEVLIKLYIRIGILFMQKKRSTNIITCDVGLSSAHLMSNGELMQCMYLKPITTVDEHFRLTDYHNAIATSQLADIKQNKCPHCWMSCYGPHSMLQAPLQSISTLLTKIE